ncbi:M12 family metallo-peptidase [Flavobacterium caeni]|uniref:Por secretion system C-terminal sorting domain-containing protein n=1 Tax=Flavobacterium caeni TaxID=490189 RepID=A0A1G5E1F8_9FLAO|nr:M12 family metallo-peptidase [Flavobacterium caeni]SCY20551.1 Por secretion system C-terminal sorting domain-containing protein [Flavobacterium caeni]
MKKLLTLMMLLACAGVFAQKSVALKVNQLLSEQADFKPVSVFTPVTGIDNAKTRSVVETATYAQLQTAPLSQLMAAKHAYIELQVPYMGQTIPVQLYQVDIFAEGFHVDTDKAANIAFTPGLYYRGIVKNDPNSVVSFSFFKDAMMGIVSNKTLGNLVVGKLQREGNVSDYIVYSDRDMKVANGFACRTKDVVKEGFSIENRSPEGVAPRCVTMYFEIDYNIYQQNGSSTDNTMEWLTGAFNEMQTLYANDGIAVALKSSFIWTEDDPYDGNPDGEDSSSDYLYQFNEVRPAFDGDVGQLLGIDPGGLGGVAVTVDGLCSQNNFCYSDVNIGYEEVPVFSWTVMVITHEFGHLLGGPHTHSCVWNGNNTAIDNCGPEALGEDWEGAECMTTPPTIPEDGGTIMSYCHLQSVGINFEFGFGEQPAQAIRNAINSSACLSTDCISTCINAVADVQVNTVGLVSTITWTELGTATSWQVAVTNYNAGNPNWVTVTEPSYTTDVLQANRFYRFWVRPVCDNGLTPPNDRHVFVTGANWCDGITIADSGGANNEYDDNESYVRVMIPNLPNKKIELTFTAFDLEAEYDYLWVYDGNSTSAPDLTNGGLDGTDIPGPFESTAADGSLTLRFYSDGGVTEEGFVAQVACLNTLAAQDFASLIDFTYYPNPTDGLVAIASKTPIDQITVYNVAGQLLYNETPHQLNAKVDIGSFATGTYFFKLKFGDKEANFKIVKN